MQGRELDPATGQSRGSRRSNPLSQNDSAVVRHGGSIRNGQKQYRLPAEADGRLLTFSRNVKMEAGPENATGLCRPGTYIEPLA
jgi:hypothetical protein